MPFLAEAYGLYYNKDLFAEAGVTAPPKTLTELSDLAKKLTKKKPDGTLERVGFLPLIGFYENSPAHMAPLTGPTWLKSDGTSNIGSDPKWQELLKWQKELVDGYGYDELEAFRASLGDEWSAENAFHTGKVAMNIDGEWHLAFLKDRAKELQFGVAPLPVDDPRRHGAGYVAGSVIGVSRTSDNPEAAWALVRYLTTDTAAIVKLSNGLRNLPTTTDALASPDLVVDAEFQVFLGIFKHPATSTTPPSAVGPAHQDEFSTGGAGGIRRRLTPYTFAITGVIGTLQYFTQAAVASSVASGSVTGGGGIANTFGYPNGSTFTYPLYLYVAGFGPRGLLGYASVLAVVLFVVSFLATILLLSRFRTFVS